MNFTDLSFVFLILPIVLVIYYVVVPKLKQLLLILFSLLFYTMLCPQYLFALIVSIVINITLAGVICSMNAENTTRRAKIVTGIGVFFDVCVLVFYKYLDFGITNLNMLFRSNLQLMNLALPLGVSFYTFKAISYLLESYRGTYRFCIIEGALYLSFFPQIQSGPIGRISHFADVSDQLKFNGELFSRGVHRFIIGYSKKILLSNILVLVTDEIFGMDYTQLSGSLAWLGSVCYSLQLLFDFSSYSDMAIGLGNMFGYECPENFDYPYMTKSFSEFWRRWHISLGSWFRDYIYIPLGGSRVSKQRVIFNLFVVWLLTGIWHGATWGYIFWGLAYFVLVAFEKQFNVPGRIKTKLAAGVYRIVILLTVNFLWVVFRIGGLRAGLQYWGCMFFAVQNPVADLRALTLLKENAFILVVSVILCTPLLSWIYEKIGKRIWLEVFITVVEVFVFVVAISMVVAGQNNPFLYANF